MQPQFGLAKITKFKYVLFIHYLGVNGLEANRSPALPRLHPLWQKQPLHWVNSVGRTWDMKTNFLEGPYFYELGSEQAVLLNKQKFALGSRHFFVKVNANEYHSSDNKGHQKLSCLKFHFVPFKSHRYRSKVKSTSNPCLHANPLKASNVHRIMVAACLY